MLMVIMVSVMVITIIVIKAYCWKNDGSGYVTDGDLSGVTDGDQQC